MYAVGRLGSYFARGVYTVSGPFHPFGGAVDIIVVEQPDGSFKSSPWYVRFGKFQGVLKTREKVVSIDVNGVEANFHMYLDHKGEAYFLKEVDIEEAESVWYPSSSGDETDGQSSCDSRPMKSESCNYDADKLNSADRIGASEKKVMSRSNSRRARILGLVFGRRSLKEDGFKEGEAGVGMVRLSPLERADYAADLLEVKWCTNLASSRARKDNDSQITSPDVSGEGVATNKKVDDEHSLVESLVHDDGRHSSYNSVLTEEPNIDLSSLDTKEVETSPLSESILEERFEMVSEISRTDEFSVGNVHRDVCEEHTQLDSILRCELEACDSKQFDEVANKKKDVTVPGCGISEESGTNRVQSFVYCETSEGSVVGPDGSNEQTPERLYLANGGCGEVHVHSETRPVTTELLPEDANGEVREDPAETSKNHSDQTNAAPCELDYKASDLEKPLRVQELSTQIVTLDLALCSSKEVESRNICTTSIGNLEVQDGDDLHKSLTSAGDSQKLFSDNVMLKTGSNAPSESSEEEQLLFGDLDDFKVSEVVDASSPDCVKKINHPLCSDVGIKEVNGSVNTNDELLSSSNMFNSSSSDCVKKVNHPLSDDGGIKEVNGSANTNDEESSCSNLFVQHNVSTDPENLIKELSVKSSPIDIPKNLDGDENVGRMAESLPILWSPTLNLTADDTKHPLSQSLDTNSDSLKWTLLSECDPSSNANEEQQFAQEQPNTVDSLISEELRAVVSSPMGGNPSQTIVSSGGSWRLWPFSLSRSSSRKAMQPALSEKQFSDAEILTESSNCMDRDQSVSESKIVKEILRSITPTSEQLASLNLKEGGNTITFTFCTPMLGKQQVDARIFLWKWNTRIVISDVDGTITKSDVLGQFMPLVGMDWSQTGVTHLFSAIKENGYQFLFLSARSISQAYFTRRFLFNLKQDGKALPEGPVVISPDGLFPSLFREVIRRAPHEFKIACLEDIRALFPADCNPFYAGFGNRDTDEISYLKVGIPRGKIFTINPKGEIAVNRRVDTKSYSSLHALVHGMFPPTTSSEQEDFNTWNFWKLPPPEIDI